MTTFDNIFSKAVRNASSSSPVLTGRTKLPMNDLINMFPNGVTVNQFDFLDGKNGVYAVIHFAESDSTYTNGGSLMTKIAQEWVNAFDGDLDAANKALAGNGGVKLRFTRMTKRDGGSFTNVTLVE